MNTTVRKAVRKDRPTPVANIHPAKGPRNPLKVAAKAPEEIKMPPPAVGCFKGKDHDCL